MTMTSMLGDGVDFALNIWAKNNDYQIERKKIEYQQAQQRAADSKNAADAAKATLETARQSQVTSIIKWGAILVLSLVSANIVFKFLSRQLKGA